MLSLKNNRRRRRNALAMKSGSFNLKPRRRRNTRRRRRNAEQADLFAGVIDVAAGGPALSARDITRIGKLEEKLEKDKKDMREIRAKLKALKEGKKPKRRKLADKTKKELREAISGKGWTLPPESWGKAKLLTYYRGKGVLPPTVAEIRAEAKALGVQGYSGKKERWLKTAVSAVRQKRGDYVAKYLTKKPRKPSTRRKTPYAKFRTKLKGLGLTGTEQRKFWDRIKDLPEAEQRDLRNLHKRGIRKAIRAAGRAEIKTALDEMRTKYRTKTGAKRKAAYKKRSAKRSGITTYATETATFLLNPFKVRRRRNKRGRRRNPEQIEPLAKGLNLVEDVQGEVAKVPGIKLISFAITPMVVGAAVYGVHRMLEPYVMKGAEDVGIAKIPVLREVLKWPYSTTSIVAGLVLGYLAQQKILNKQAASILAASACSVGIALDLSLRPFAKAATEVATEQTAKAAGEIQAAAAEVTEQVAAGIIAPGAVAPAVAAAEAQAALAGYGDGGAYMIGSDTHALGSYGAIQVGGAYGAIEMDYADACPADAYQASDQMHKDEASAAIAGPGFWKQKFGASPTRMRQVESLYSRHAGHMGSRYGWLIKMIGFANFQKIAAMNPAQRASVINQLRQQAIASLPKVMAQAKRQNAGLETASLPVQGGFNGAQGFGGVGYGALMFAGSGY
jgi:hypothetical protein